MTSGRSLAGMLVIAALALCPRAAAAASASILANAPAPAVHTAAVSHHRHHHLAFRHSHHHHARVAQLTRRETQPTLPRSRPEPPHRAERRAALPHQLRNHGHEGGSRGGARHLASVAPGAGLPAVSARRLECSQNLGFAALGEWVMSGRGPPRAGPLPNSIPSSSAGSRFTLRSADLRLESIPDPSLHSSTAPAMALPCPVATRRRHRSRFDPEQLNGRSHVDRLEGATTCHLMPSSGELS